MPSAQANIGHALGYNFATFSGFWAQYWTQSPSASQYRTVDSYTPASTDFDDLWTILYSGALQNLKFVERQATADKKYNYSGIAKLLEAYTFQLLTDNFNEVPFSQALKIEQGITSPAYDKQEAIYDGIIALAKDGLADIDKAALSAKSITPNGDDLIYHGVMSNWTAFGNTLLLKMYLRISDRNSTKAQVGIASLATATFISDGQTAKINYSATGGNENPLDAAVDGPVLNGTQNLMASSTIIDSFNNYGDYRVMAFYTTTAATYVGIQQGGYATATASGKAIPSSAVGGTAGDPASKSAPVILLSDYESYFLQAEAIARGWLAGTASTAFYGGINASLNAYIPSAASIGDTTGYYAFDIAATYPFPSTLPEQIHAIALQKWMAMCGNQNCEAWIEQRRFDYPNLPLSAAANGITGNKLPGRFLYPDVEVSRNLNFQNGTMKQLPITDKVWWDKN